MKAPHPQTRYWSPQMFLNWHEAARPGCAQLTESLGSERTRTRFQRFITVSDREL